MYNTMQTRGIKSKFLGPLLFLGSGSPKKSQFCHNCPYDKLWVVKKKKVVKLYMKVIGSQS